MSTAANKAKRQELLRQRQGLSVSKFRHLCPKLAGSIGQVHNVYDADCKLERRLTVINGGGQRNAPLLNKFSLGVIKGGAE